MDLLQFGSWRRSNYANWLRPKFVRYMLQQLHNPYPQPLPPGPAAQAFLHQVGLYFLSELTQFPTDRSKIIFVVWRLQPLKNSTYPPAAADPKAMDLSAMNSQLSDTNQAKLMKNSQCFCCHQKGHLSRNCPGRTGQSSRP
ncbi:hypothetical protein VP01_531g7 [Puccinia sorghi]|uniref:CCHC-type domain-containing protein n=1 Tax=Puccinia sorghi TaxID=27349 RepID=A0A0L6UK68_9BASI|nr:hypothetical protein VP01_531g7 [Puccinia sorghi]